MNNDNKDLDLMDDELNKSSTTSELNSSIEVNNENLNQANDDLEVIKQLKSKRRNKRRIKIFVAVIFLLLIIAYFVISHSASIKSDIESCENDDYNYNESSNSYNCGGFVSRDKQHCIDTCKRRASRIFPSTASYKPLIYLYPTKPTRVSVSVNKPDNLTTTYPKYNNDWTVLAQPNGNLKQINDSRTYYGLYWEGKNGIKTEFYDGFVVAKDDLIPFLESKLATLGLNEREANEFIIYWLPILERNDYNKIRFLTKTEIDNNMKLNISPKPDTIIRVLMQFEKANRNTKLPVQRLTPVKRQGFTVVEWGGLRRNWLKQ